jgi:hypothetical protein
LTKSFHRRRAERARLDEIRFRGERPDERLLELYGAGDQPA